MSYLSHRHHVMNHHQSIRPNIHLVSYYPKSKKSPKRNCGLMTSSNYKNCLCCVLLTTLNGYVTHLTMLHCCSLSKNYLSSEALRNGYATMSKNPLRLSFLYLMKTNPCLPSSAM